ncbi:MAG: hypothetical protein ABEJ31_08165 [Haloarculaceae archaeon]
MSLYADRFETDWDALDRDEATERAFALGVAASLGEHNPEEFEAIQAEMGSNYDSSIVELAYEEGKRKARKRKRATDSDADDRDVWEFVINEELADAEPPEREDGPAERATDLPSAVTERTGATDKPDPDPEQTEFPEFLE